MPDWHPGRQGRVMDALDGGFWQYGDDSYPAAGVTFFAGTFVRHPLALAATAAVLKHIKSAGPSLQERLSERTGRLVDDIKQRLRAAWCADRDS